MSLAKTNNGEPDLWRQASPRQKSALASKVLAKKRKSSPAKSPSMPKNAKKIKATKRKTPDQQENSETSAS